MEINFCCRCGEKLALVNNSSWRCANSHSTFLSPTPTAGVFLLNNRSEVVLSRRGIQPGKGMLDSIGGFIDSKESAEEAIIREIEEETGLTTQDYEPLQIFCTAPSIYRYENEDKLVLSIFFWSRLLPHARPIAKDDVAEIVTSLPDEVQIDEFYGEDVKSGFLKFKQMLKNEEL